MKSERSSNLLHHTYMIGYAKVGELVVATFVTALIFAFYLAHYSLNTGFFTNAFTPILAAVFFTSVLFPIVTSFAKVITPRKDIVALVEVIGAAIFVAVAAWLLSSFPLNFSHVTDIVPIQFRFAFTWLTNDVGRIIVALTVLGGTIALAVDVIRLVWRVSSRRFGELPRFEPRI